MKDQTFSKQVILHSTNRCLYASELLGKFDIMIKIIVKNGSQLRQIYTPSAKNLLAKIRAKMFQP